MTDRMKPDMTFYVSTDKEEKEWYIRFYSKGVELEVQPDGSFTKKVEKRKIRNKQEMAEAFPAEMRPEMKDEEKEKGKKKRKRSK